MESVDGGGGGGSKSLVIPLLIFTGLCGTAKFQ